MSNDTITIPANAGAIPLKQHNEYSPTHIICHKDDFDEAIKARSNRTAIEASIKK